MNKYVTVKLTADQVRLLEVTLQENLNDDPIPEAYKAFCRRLLAQLAKAKTSTT